MFSLTAVVSGRLQGVGYRAFVHATASQLGIEASATNMPDGTVIVEAQGDRAALESFLAVLQEGPPHAKVEHVDSVWRE